MLSDSVSHGLAVETVRLDRGLTQAVLAKAAGLSQAALSKAETDQVPLTGARLEAVAAALECPVALLVADQPFSLASTACVFHRKRANTTVAQASRARARLALSRVHAEALLQLVGASDVRLPREAPTADEYVTPEEIARKVRAAIGAPRGPLLDLSSALESTGAIIMVRDLGGPRLDALSDWVTGRRPVLVVSATAPGDRRRFSLAHEAGHAVMHDAPGIEAEDQANRFAAELLMPARDIKAALAQPTLEGLLALKQAWRVSAAALLHRAFDLHTVSDYAYRRLNTEMSAAGWRTAEPLPIPRERPRALAHALAQARETHTDADIASRILLLPEQLDAMFDPEEAS